MGTNYYLRYKTPRMVFDEIHIAKRSAGWKPIFQAHEGKFRSIQELRDCYLQGDYEIVDEYGDVYDWDSFNHEVVEWERRQKESNPEREVDRLLDHLLDFAGEDRMLGLFKRVCRKYLYRYPKAVADHIYMWRDMYDEEYAETQKAEVRERNER